MVDGSVDQTRIGSIAASRGANSTPGEDRAIAREVVNRMEQ